MFGSPESVTASHGQWKKPIVTAHRSETARSEQRAEDRGIVKALFLPMTGDRCKQIKLLVDVPVTDHSLSAIEVTRINISIFRWAQEH